MPELMKTPHTDTVTMTFSVPPSLVPTVRDFMKSQGIAEERDTLPWREVLPMPEENRCGMLLSGARYREGLTQAQLSEMTGIPRRHISEMENSKRPIGKQNARKLAEALNVDPRLLLSV